MLNIGLLNISLLNICLLNYFLVLSYFKIKGGASILLFFVPVLLGDFSLCWDHLEVVQTPHTCQALPCGSRAETWFFEKACLIMIVQKLRIVFDLQDLQLLKDL